MTGSKQTPAGNFRAQDCGGVGRGGEVGWGGGGCSMRKVFRDGFSNGSGTVENRRSLVGLIFFYSICQDAPGVGRE